MTNDERLSEAGQRFTQFLGPVSGRIAVLHDLDADGIAAGVILDVVFRRAGRTAVRIVTNADRSAWSEGNRRRIGDLAPDRLFVLDLGCRADPLVPGVPTCFIDHHRPESVAADDTLISGYGWDPAPNTSWLAWELAKLVADVSDLDWIAAVGVLSDLGDRAPFPMLAQARRTYTARALKETAALVNAIRRASPSEPEAAARALLAHQSPRALVESESPDVRRMRDARREVQAAMTVAKTAAPVFAGPVALIRINSACQIHPLVAQIWRSRLPAYVVMVANESYRPGRVHFSMRSREINVLDFLRNVPLPGGAGEYGHGHDQASGGSLPIARWNQLLAALGFPERVRLREDLPAAG